MDGAGHYRLHGVTLACASWDFSWPAAPGETAGSKILLGVKRGCRIRSLKPFSDGVLRAFVGSI